MLRRARLLFAFSLLAAVALVATGFPIGQLVHARAAASAAASQLSRVRQENRTLAEQVRQLQSGSVIEQIAHEDYGLVLPGQRSYVVMPSGGRSTATRAGDPLAAQPVPPSDLVPSDAALSPSPPARGPEAGQSFWQRLLNRLEFWKAVA